MKNTLKYFALAALFSLAACAPEYPEMSESLLPQASDLDVTVTVDQSTNYATFNISNQGMVPVWIFGTELIDGKAGKNYAYTGNGVTLRFREAGEHSVEVKAYNASGLSVGSKVVTFSMNETYRDPFNAEPYVKAISGGDSQDWVWNSTEDGHFGCGPVGSPLDWWSCGALGKAGFLYDDVMTFDSEGNYTFTPGDGMAYANTGSEYMDEYNTGEDYLFPAETKTTKYSFENNWNDAGIEEVYLVLDAGSILSYVPHKSIVSEPRYLVMESKPANMKKKLQMMATVYTPNNLDGISWYYEFVPQGSAAGDADPLYGYESKIWVLDNTASGYMGCGPDVGNSTGWWSASPHDKDNFGVTDDEITFFANGKYVFDPGADGLVYCNWESGYLPDGHNYSGDNSTDYDAPASRQESTYTLGSDSYGDYIELPAGIFFTYVPRPEVLSEPTRLYIKENTLERLVLAPYFEGIIAWNLIFKPKEGQDYGQGTGGDVSYTYGDNLFADGYLQETWFSPADWSGGLDPAASFENGTLTLTVPEGVGGNEWQGQVKLVASVPADPEKQYSFSCKLESAAEGMVTVKVADAAADAAHAFFYDPDVVVEAYDVLSYTKEPISPDQAYEAVMVIFDFGRLPAGTQVTVTDISLREITGTTTGGGYGDNIWEGSYLQETWFSPADWSGGLDPEASYENGTLTLTVPEGVGGSEWQGQVKLVAPVAADPASTYSFACNLESSSDGKVTVKVADAANDSAHAFFYDPDVVVEAYDVLSYTKEPISPDQAYESVMVIFDFGRLPAGTQVTVTDITLRKAL